MGSTSTDYTDRTYLDNPGDLRAFFEWLQAGAPLAGGEEHAIVPGCRSDLIEAWQEYCRWTRPKLPKTQKKAVRKTIRKAP